jgi:uncharacterized membrane protein YbhN (UPF0104 family)
MRNLWPRIKPFIQILFSLLSLFWVIHVLRKIDWSITGESLGNLSVPLLTACFFLVALLYLTRFFRLRYWVQNLSGNRLSMSEWADLYLKSIAFGSVTPARLGDFSRIPLLVKTGLDLMTRSKITFYDKLADSLYIPIGICITSHIVGEKLNIQPVWIFSGGILSLISYIFISYWFAGFLGIRALLVGWVMTLLGLGLFILSNIFLFWSVGINLTMLEVAAITLSVGIIVALPISVGGIGLREGSLICMLGLWGIKPEVTPPVLIFEFILNMVFPVALFMCWILFKELVKSRHSGENRSPDHLEPFEKTGFRLPPE